MDNVKACYLCKYFSEDATNWYKENATECSPFSFGSCTKSDKDFITGDPFNNILSWCEGGYDFYK